MYPEFLTRMLPGEFLEALTANELPMFEAQSLIAVACTPAI